MMKNEKEVAENGMMGNSWVPPPDFQPYSSPNGEYPSSLLLLFLLLQLTSDSHSTVHFPATFLSHLLLLSTSFLCIFSLPRIYDYAFCFRPSRREKTKGQWKFAASRTPVFLACAVPFPRPVCPRFVPRSLHLHNFQKKYFF